MEWPTAGPLLLLGLSLQILCYSSAKPLAGTVGSHGEDQEVLRFQTLQSARARNTMMMRQQQAEVDYAWEMEHKSFQNLWKEKEAKLVKLGKSGENLKGGLGRFGCTLCKAVVGLVQESVAQGRSDQEIVSLATGLCIHLGIEDDQVCIGIVREFQTEVLTVLGTLVLAPKEVCGALFGKECGTPYDPWDSWNITLPSTPKPPVPPYTPPKPGSPTLRMLHLTDIHLDLEYSPGSKGDCGEPLCCRKSNGPPDAGGAGAGQWGDYRNCDTPVWTLLSLLQHLQATQDQFDYIIWTGDAPPHDVWMQSRAGQLHTLKTLTSLLRQFLPSKPVFAALGNHEGVPVDSFPPPFVKGNNSVSWLYSALQSQWSHWLPNSTFPSLSRGAYYTVSPFPGLRIVSLNMNYCNNMNWWLLLNTTDPAEELQWLASVLQEAEDRHEKVHIIGHIPPGTTDCLKAWSWNYYRIINRYESTVMAQFFGHTHYDHFEVFYDDVHFKRPVSVAYITPSVTPYVGLNMGYRIYTLDGHHPNSSWAVLDHETHILNLTQANAVNATKWAFEYSAKAAYNLTDLTPKSWDCLINTMKTDDAVLQKFYRFYTKSHSLEPCDGQCRVTLLCGLRSGRSHDENTFCGDLTQGDPLPEFHLPKVC